jgi:hypothetical protein
MRPQTGAPYILLACDERFAMPLATTLRSIVESQPDATAFRFCVMTDRFGASERAKVQSSLPAGSPEVEWVPISLDRFSGLETP